MRAKVNGQKDRHLRAVEAISTGLDIAPEQLVPESVHSTVEAAAVTLRIDAAKMTETLARFGITLEIS